MKKKIFGIAISLLCAISSMFALSACTSKHHHAWNPIPKYNDAQHWLECSCGSRSKIANHTYDNDCDPTCNGCGYIRTVTHSFSTNWSSNDYCHWHNCLNCDAYDTYIPHTYVLKSDETQHWYECSVCNHVKGRESHNYVNGECLVCKKHTHFYSTIKYDGAYHWAECSCGEQSNMERHSYDSDCDPTCNGCGYERTAPHNYSSNWSSDASNHWHECSKCHTYDVYEAHTYVLKSDATKHWYECSVCGRAKDQATHTFDSAWHHDDSTGHYHVCSTCNAHSAVSEHSFENACDKTCDDCGYTREITHNYATVWSSDDNNHWHVCTVCGDKKDVAAHTYTIHEHNDTQHWLECECGAKSNITNHSYDNDCDTTCNGCDYTRTIQHNYSESWSSDDNNHWHECSVCHTHDTDVAHTYVLKTDGTNHWQQCSVCGHKKDETAHTYSTQKHDSTHHWLECECGAKSNVTNHSYDNDCDTTCNGCSYTRTIQHNYSESWSSDDNNHWHECSVCHTHDKDVEHSYKLKSDADYHWYECSVCNHVKGKEEHRYEGDDECTICEKHTHNYSTLKHNDTKHWYECSCGDEKDVEDHTYDNACDKTCNVCGYEREITHDYSESWSSDDNNHWHECSVCHTHDTNVAHTYELKTDGTNHWQQCSVCGHKKDETAHTYSTQKHDNTHHWLECECGAKSNVTEHKFDNACDTKCDDCGYERTITHNYELKSDENNHWKECSVCKDKIDEQAHTFDSTWHYDDSTGHYHVCSECNAHSVVSEHTFDNDCDTTCNDCSYTRTTQHNYVTQCDKNNHWHECSVCGDKQDDSTAHTYVDGVCSVCGNISNMVYTYNSSTQTYSLTNGKSITATAITIPSTYDDGTNGRHPVTSIGTNAFYNCTNLTSIVIPDSVTSIGVGVFENCTNLTSIVIPDSVTSIGNYAFYNCTNLTSIVIPDSVTSIGNYAFYGCENLWEVYNLSKLNITAGYSSYGYVAYYAVAVYKSLGESKISTDANGYVIYADENNKILVGYVGSDTDLTLPTDITQIYQNVFKNNTSITSVTIPASVTSIGVGVFENCTNLTSIVIPDSVTSIGNYAFYGCENLWEVYNLSKLNITAGYSSYGYVAYYAVAVYKSLGESKISTDANGYVIYADENNKILVGYVGSDTDLTLPTDITQIYQNVFSVFKNNTSITSVTIPASVTSIGSNAFLGCTNLTKVNYLGTIDQWAQISFSDLTSNPTYYAKALYINDQLVTEINLTTVTQIRTYAFVGCEDITSVVIPTSVKTIYSTAFEYCYSFNTIYYKGTESQWSNIFIDTMYENSIWDSAVIYYYAETESDLPSSCGNYWHYDSKGNIAIWQMQHNCEETWLITQSSHWRVCSSCGNKVDLSAHTFVNGVCSECGTIENLIFTYNSNTQTYSVSDGQNITVTALTIPSTYNDGVNGIHPVTSIEHYAFRGRINTPDGQESTSCGLGLISVIIPDSVTSIGYDTFAHCSNLTTVIIGDGVTSIGYDAFAYCRNLTTVIIGDGVTSIGDDAFCECYSLTNLVIGSSVTSIYYKSFAYCQNLTTVYYKGTESQWNNITITGGSVSWSSSYQYLTNATKYYYIENESSVPKDCGNYWHYDSEGAIEVWKNSHNVEETWASDKDNHWHKCSTCGSKLDYEEHNYVNCTCSVCGYIDGSSFVYNSLTQTYSLEYYSIYAIQYAITSLTIPSIYNDGTNGAHPVTSIGSRAFENCINLTSITIPASITSISYYAIQSHYDVSIKINFLGTIDQWAEIDFGTDNDMGYYSEQKALYINNQLVTEVNLTTATKISAYAFRNYKDITKVVIPASVTSIGTQAFCGCENLWEVYDLTSTLNIKARETSNGYVAYYAYVVYDSLDATRQISTDKDGYTTYTDGENVTLIAYNGTATELTLPSNITAIADKVFFRNEKITKVTIGNNVTTIGESEFSGCTSLTSVTIGSSVTSISMNAFSNCYKLWEVYDLSALDITAGGSSHGYVAYYAVVVYKSSGDSRLTTDANGYVTYSDETNKILVGYVGSDSKLTLPSDITQIYTYAFYENNNITSVTIPDSVTSIGYEAFKNCTSLTSVTIGSGVTSIGYYAFYGCENLFEVYDLNPLEITKGSSDNGYVAYYALDVYTSREQSKITTQDGYVIYTDGDSKKLIAYIGTDTDLILPDGITEIDAALFMENRSITSIIISDSVTNIGNYAFQYCYSLTNLVIGSGVTTIGDQAFDGCYSLTCVYYKGTATEWNSITISTTTTWGGEDNGNSQLRDNATKYYYIANEIDVPKDCGNYWHYDSEGAIEVWTASHTVSTTWLIDFQNHWAKCSNCHENIYFAHTYELKTDATKHWYECSACGYKKNVTAHTYDNDWHYDDETGHYHVCSTCNTRSAVSEHTYTDNCDTICNDCEYERTAPHNNASGWLSDATNHWHVCSDCNDIVDLSAHTYVNGACSECGNIENLIFTYDETTQTYSVTNGKNIKVTSLTIPSTYNDGVNGTHPVTTIGEMAFYGCASLTSVVIPDSITSIGNGAFYNCTSLINVKIGNNVTTIGEMAFSGCTSLTSVVIPNSVTTIGEIAFYGCYRLVEVYNLSSLNIHNGVGSTTGDFGYVADYALVIHKSADDASILSTDADGYVTTDNSTTLIGYIGNATKLTLPAGITEINKYAFYGCTDITSVTIPKSVTSIGWYAFNGCVKLVEVYNLSNLTIKAGSSDNGYVAYYALAVYNNSSTASKTSTDENGYVIYDDGTNKILVGYTGTETDLTLPEGITEINKRVFSSNYSITSVVIPNTVTTIGDYAFSHCYNLTSVTIGSNVKSIGDCAFMGCGKLWEVYNLSPKLTITAGSYDNGQVAADALVVYTSLDTPSKISTDANGYIIYDDGTDKVLLGYTGTDTELTLPEGITEINKRVFSSNYSITSVVIPDSVITIGDDAFSYCEQLTTVIIGKGVTNIGSFAFAGCYSLTNVIIPKSVTYIGRYAFENCMSLTVVYYMGTASDWANITFDGEDDEWNSYTSKLKEATIYYYTEDDSNFTCEDANYWHYDAEGNVAILPAHHTYGTWESDGTNHWRTCSTCGDVETAQHTFDNGHDTICDDCGYTREKTHTYVDGVCSECGDVKNLVYTYDATTQTYSVTNGKNITATAITIPSTYDDGVNGSHPVTSIGSKAFAGHTSLTSITIPATVTYFGASAFEDMLNLTEVKYLGTIDQWAEITFADYHSNPIMGVSNSGGYYQACNFYINDQLVTEVNLTTATKVSAYAFNHYGNVSRVILGDSVTTIEKLAFGCCTNLTSVTLGSNVTTIAEAAFEYCPKLFEVYNLSNLTITAGLADYGYVAYYALAVYNNSSTTSNISTDANGYVIYTDGDDKILVGYTGTDTDLTLPSGITEIYQSAFENNSSITSVVIPNTVTSIGQNAFYYCSNLLSVTIGSGVTEIGGMAFECCTKLFEVYNLSSTLEITAGTYGNGEVAYYALDVYTSLDTPSKLSTENGYVIYTDGDSKKLISYIGTETDLILPEGITEIYQYAFERNYSITSVVIPNSVTSIGDNAFTCCVVYYQGTADDWDAISIGSSNLDLTNYIRYYYIENESDVPTDGGNYWHYDTDGKTPVVWQIGTTDEEIM